MAVTRLQVEGAVLVWVWVCCDILRAVVVRQMILVHTILTFFSLRVFYR